MKVDIIDARGFLCPKPLIMTKKALNNRNKDSQISILIDNETAMENVERFLHDNGVNFITTELEGYYKVAIISATEKIDSVISETYCPIPLSKTKTGSHIIKISSNLMGTGDDELGNLLMQAFINTLKEVSPLPSKIVLYNSGVKLVVDSSSVFNSLKELEDKGIQIIVCGTCVDFFGIKDQISIGIISNMYTIMETLTDAERIVEP